MATHSERLKELSIDLPAVTTPVGAYVPALRHGDLLFLSGQVPLLDGKVAYTGKVGDGRTPEDAIAAARIWARNRGAVAERGTPHLLHPDRRRQHDQRPPRRFQTAASPSRPGRSSGMRRLLLRMGRRRRGRAGDARPGRRAARRGAGAPPRRSWRGRGSFPERLHPGPRRQPPRVHGLRQPVTTPPLFPFCLTSLCPRCLRGSCSLRPACTGPSPML